MTTALLTTLVVLGLLAFAALVLVLALRRRPGLLASRYRESVLVSCKDGATFSGVLYASDDKTLVLRSSEAVGVGDNSTNLPLDGEIIVLLADVSYLQRP